MSSSYFANLAAKRTADGDVKLGWGATDASDAALGATALGDARRVKREAKVSPADAVDFSLPDVVGTVVSISKNSGSWSSYKLGIAVSKVEIPENSVTTTRLPSGTVIQVASKKLDRSLSGGEKISLPHVFPPLCAIVKIDGVIVVEIKGLKNGLNEAELKEEMIPIGTKLKLKSVVVDFVHKAATDAYPTPSISAYASAKSIDFGDGFVKGPTHPILRTDAVFDALLWLRRRRRLHGLVVVARIHG